MTVNGNAFKCLASMCLLLVSKYTADFFFFLVALDLLCCKQSFSGCAKWGLLSSHSVQVSHFGVFSCCGAQALGMQASVVAAPGLYTQHRLSNCGAWLGCPTAGGSFLDPGSNWCSLHWQVDS